MNIARIQDGIVINIEVGDQEWLDSQELEEGENLVPYLDDLPAHIGLGYDQANGFEQPEIPNIEETP